ncbi:MAG: sigma-70 family RNA polymerase sigma factor [Pseudonocardia sp.]|nr:sigma-70 family RNA polymerase sigma factor [Pseudonocardia sp.]MBO0873391.1 sigma-70 family RNA polymerase sigma factor [Pseudonocardia sp.]
MSTTTRTAPAVENEPDLVGRYLGEIGTVALLTAPEEVDLAKRIEAGVYASELLRGELRRADHGELEEVARDGARAKDQMIRANLRLVVAAARKYRRSGLPLLDLIQEGNLGLIRAVEKFDYAKGYKFSTYAMWWIRQAIQRGVAAQGRTIRLPDHVLDQLSRLDRLERDLVRQLRRDPTIAELAEAAGLTVERVTDLRHAAKVTVSLDSPVGENDETPVGEFIDHIRAVRDDADEHDSMREELRERLRLLSPIEKSIIMFRYGLHDGRQHTLQQTAAYVGLNREGTRRLERQALEHLRRPPSEAASSGLLDAA